jgi:hypothetical protein
MVNQGWVCGLLKYWYVFVVFECLEFVSCFLEFGLLLYPTHILYIQA